MKFLPFLTKNACRLIMLKSFFVFKLYKKKCIQINEGDSDTSKIDYVAVSFPSSW